MKNKVWRIYVNSATSQMYNLELDIWILGSECSWRLENLMISLFQFLKNAFLVQSLSHVQLFATPQTTECQASRSSLSPRVSAVFISIQSVMLSNHLLLCFSPSPLALSLSQHQGLFQWVSSLHQVAKVLELQLQRQSFQWTFRIDLL